MERPDATTADRDDRPSAARSVATLRERIQRFCEREIAPHAAAIDAEDAFPRWLWPRLGELGILGPTVSESDGGAGLGLLEHLILVEELSRASGAVGMSYAAHSNLCVHNLWLHGTVDQRRRWLPGLLSGEHVGALAMSEAEAGSDVIGSMTCRAERGDRGWVANGAKMWITNGPEADVLIVYMRTAPASERASVTAFVVERGMPGFRASDKLDKLGMRGSPTSELVFTDCRIPDDNVLGEVGDGARLLMQGLDSERLVLCGGPIGIMQAALDLTLPYLRERRQFGRPIGSFELMQGKLADMHVALESSRALAYRVAERFADDPRGRHAADAAGSLMHASENAVRVALEAIQVFGGRGYLNDGPAGRLLRDAKLYTIGAGTNEIRRMLIGRALTGRLD